MQVKSHSHHTHHRFILSYPTTLWEKFYVIFLVPALFVVAILFLDKGPTLFPGAAPSISLSYLGMAFLETFFRLLIAYALALVVAVPLAILADKNAFAERLLLPLFDIVQSVPVLAFFPIIIAFFLQFGLYSSSAIFILFLSMLWNIVFSTVGGLKSIPNDIKEVSRVFHVRGVQYLTRILLPAVVPYLVTGSLLAWAQGWNIIIVAEVLHTYIPGGSDKQDLFGIGSLMVHSMVQGRSDLFIASVGFLIFAIAILNFFVWQKLLHYAERFKFE